MLGMVEGERKRGRPKHIWLDEVKEALCMQLGNLEGAHGTRSTGGDCPEKPHRIGHGYSAKEDIRHSQLQVQYIN